MIDSATVDAAVQALVQAANPPAIVLFGSHARGDANDDLGQPGYVCDDVPGYEGTPYLPPSMGDVLRNRSLSQGRFIAIGNLLQSMPANRP